MAPYWIRTRSGDVVGPLPDEDLPDLLDHVVKVRDANGGPWVAPGDTRIWRRSLRLQAPEWLSGAAWAAAVMLPLAVAVWWVCAWLGSCAGGVSP